MPLPHSVPNAGIRVQAGENALAYSGDTAPDPMLAELGRGAGLFIIESTDRDGETQRPDRNLMTSAEARFRRRCLQTAPPRHHAGFGGWRMAPAPGAAQVGNAGPACS